ncbi:type IV pilus modification protein PilV [Pseudomonas sp. PDNC002]|uniref:type IV pilus modification protein PilV n=1 Tax=Pseudomonas sp. PDNC002 TaxID=2811422 RepID=UPI001966B3CE|nr:type IV pilus modification protein PilV [Pseudomonas sp. PDNC002]QRY79867.1 type IV pilus modification protein PilV [Pseudomonas sp. PDNC002]
MDSRLRGKGFTLIELLVSLVILSIGLLGLAGLQNVGIAANYSSLQRSQASWLASEMAELLRANPVAARAGSYDTGFSATAGGCPSLSGSTRAQLDLSQWLGSVCEALGGTGSGSVRVVRNGDLYSAIIAVRWDDGRARRRLTDSGESWEIFTFHAGL